MKRYIYFLPVIVFLILSFFLYRGLFKDPMLLKSVLIGKPMPDFALSQLDNIDHIVTLMDLPEGIIILNVWATWCPACRYEHKFLNQLSLKEKQFSIIGLNYRDNKENALHYLSVYGDPFEFSLYDDVGSLAFNLGVYGAPETFLIDSERIIRYRYAGILDDNVWNSEFKPILVELMNE